MLRLTMNLWNELKKLQGRTLRTLSQGKPFDILEVSNRDVIVVTSNGKVRPVPLKKFERAFVHLERHKALSLVDIRHLGISNFHPTYIVAILANFSGVSYKIKPIVLRMNE